MTEAEMACDLADTRLELRKREAEVRDLSRLCEDLKRKVGVARRERDQASDDADRAWLEVERLRVLQGMEPCELRRPS
jgi:hypothetical protein